MPIVLFRVDERLIHGQVVVGWGGPLHADRIVVVDDEIAGSSWEQELYCLGVPPEIEASFLGVEDARRRLPTWRSDPHRIVVLVRDLATVRRLAEGELLRNEEVNLGGIHHTVGRERVLPYLFLSPAERDDLRTLAAQGVRLSARDLPGSRRVPLEELLGGG
ncbi:MAG TPA: PTS sugar transporter subunit IIB [Longimicrobiaceae bacterium]|nr:PTS sugar transporter subunit IIB [Longimicrobiaceae bacterium]